jgi:hypothetical protein
MGESSISGIDSIGEYRCSFLCANMLIGVGLLAFDFSDGMGSHTVGERILDVHNGFSALILV